MFNLCRSIYLMEFAIRYVFDALTGELFDATEIFGTIQQGQLFRKEYHVSDQQLKCKECFQKATVSTNQKGRVFFKHFPNTDYCIFKDDGFSSNERSEVEAFIGSKESKRHKSLKNQIGDMLRKTQGVLIESVTVDDRYVKDSFEQRRPDVYCEYKGMRIAFEIQLSSLPPKYIFKRHEFYKRNNTYLIWILDDFDVRGQSQTEKDIKYLNKHQNFFYFNDSTKNSSLVAQYKVGWLDNGGYPNFKWTHSNVTLADLVFDPEDFQVFYRSLADESARIEKERLKPELGKALSLMRKLYQTNDERIIKLIEDELMSIDFHPFQILNETIGGVHNSDIYFKALEGTGKFHFVRFLLNSIRFEKNLNTKDATGKNLLEYILENKQLVFTQSIVRLIFANGYSLSATDLKYLRKRHISNGSLINDEIQLVQITAFNQLRTGRLIEFYDHIEGPILTILSAKQGRIIGFGFKNWISLANNAIHSYKRFWPFIERAFVFYGKWKLILDEDKKGTFNTKHQNFLKNLEKDNFEPSYVVIENLFPELFNASAVTPKWIEDLESLL